MSQLSMLPPDVKHLLTIEQAWTYKIVPEKLDTTGLHLFIDEKQSTSDIKSELEVVLGKSVHLTPLSCEDIDKSLNINYPKAHQNINEVASVQLSIKDGNFLESLVKEAQNLRSSDIHIEVYDDKCRIRFRVDGQLIERHKVNKT